MSYLSKQKVKEKKKNMLEASLGLHAITNMQRTNFLKSTHFKHYLDVHLTYSLPPSYITQISDYYFFSSLPSIEHKLAAHNLGQ